MYLLGIDIGTSSCKTALFNPTGGVVAQASESYPVFYPQEGWAEQNPLDWWQAVCKTIKKIIEQSEIIPSEIVGIGVAGQSWSAVPLTADGQVLANTPIWMDSRAATICQKLKKQIGEKRLFQLCGNPLQPTYTLPKILWYKEHLPEIYQRIDKILQSNSYIVYQLTGCFSQDVSQGYGYHFFDMQKDSYDQTICMELGISPEILPDIYACHDIVGKVTKEAALQTGLPAGIPVVAGGLDSACGALGSGVIQAGETQEQGGQAGGMGICLNTYQADKRLILSKHVVPNKWLLQGGTVGGGGVLNWLEKQIGDAERLTAADKNTNSFIELSRLAEKVHPGSNGLIFLPYMAGERSPIWNPKAKGVYYGLDFSKTKGHLIRAGMEGVAYSLKHNLETAKESGIEVSLLQAMGGAANSEVWTQIKSDITGKEIRVVSTDTTTTLGAALLAGVGTRVYTDFEDAIAKTVSFGRTHYPNPEFAEIYQEGYQKYLAIYEALKGLMN
ncbi:xylulokinase [Enterococcus pallens]|uniref:Xylulose kinase n=1 Tax=Enterococcus pallens ATCC BAA-351 TaxID=1158607 RepID=R2T2D6_9ENTE|nr:xylulokinase [Enterococcus pallens]EOH94404.1 xylulokinase [Enterococcus pallens ATCC BAA-351]EOU24283.1 xylulokinase [Enterococcus pallens ATCC BAA-351]